MPIRKIINKAIFNSFNFARSIKASIIAAQDERDRIKYRKDFALSYYKDKLEFIDTWAKLFTENSNFYYKLTNMNRNDLADLIACLLGCSHTQILDYLDELENDSELRDHLESSLKQTSYGKDISVEYGRRLGWYAFARALKPKVIVETGVDHGVGACVLASALLRNKSEGFLGRYYGTELRPEAGQFFSGKYASVGEIIYGDSIESLNLFPESIDLFINDSDHSAQYEYNEYLTISNKLSSKAVILGDNSHGTNCLSRFSREKKRRFVFFL